MLHGHKYKVTFLLLSYRYFLPLLACYLLVVGGGGLGWVGVQLGEASSSGGNGVGVRTKVNSYSHEFNSGSSSTFGFGRAGGPTRGNGGSSSGKDSSSANSNSEDSLRREYIKVQILQRLGLNEKPHVDMAHKISKDLVLETLRRTENLNDLSSSVSSDIAATTASYHPNNSTIQVDEETGVANYAKTSEIISFPDKGPVLNGHNLLTFSYAGSQAFGVGVRVKRAHLWVKLDYRSSIGRHFSRLFVPKGITLYVFQVHGNFSTQFQTHQTVHLNIQDVDLELVVKRTISLDSLGWQKLDVTSVVQKWYGKQSRHRIRHANNNRHQHHHNGHAPSNANNISNNRGDKLTLLVDCSGCGYCIQPIIFSRESTTAITLTDNDNNSEEEIYKNSQQSASSSSSSSTLMSEDNRKPDESSQGVIVKSNAMNSYWSPNNPSISSKMSPQHRQPNFDYENSNMNTDNYFSLDYSASNKKVDNFTEMPFLVLETESAPNFKRSRRRALECSPRVKHCCKQRFYISFKDLDWDDWIIAPKGYYANYCRGSCGGPHRTPDTFLNYHTHVLEEYKRTPEGQANLSGITPCCAPTKFAPMSLIYFGPDLNIIKRDLPKMIVEECGCP